MRRILTDAEVEASAAQSLRTWLRTQGYTIPDTESQIKQLFDEGGFRSRFLYFLKFVDDASKRHLLVSGTAIGTEMRIALDYQFDEVSGTEVVPELVSICKSRIAASPKLGVFLYDGTKLPFDDGSFSSIMSGHVIEHTKSPRLYFGEHLRVLEKGGVMFLEFPHRYNWVEMHTGMPSIEWFPKALRFLIAKAVTCRASPLSTHVKETYRLIIETLQPVSVLQIRWWCRFSPWKIRVEDCYIPTRGIVRMVLRKM
jgi:SAM-dependent methyltransferase